MTTMLNSLTVASFAKHNIFAQGEEEEEDEDGDDVLIRGVGEWRI